MSILFHCPWHDSKEWLQKIKKRFKDNKIYTLKNKPDLWRCAPLLKGEKKQKESVHQQR